jgi:hypothetical protein
MSSQACKHVEELEEVTLDGARVCIECVKTGSSWVHLRTCQACGLTHCCDSSPNKHASAHWNSSQHPVMVSAEPGERWLWCYAHEQMTSY